MHRRILLGLLLLGLAAFLPHGAKAREVIQDYAVLVEVQDDSALVVTEKIRVHADGIKIKRGIFRDFPTKHRTPDGTILKTTFELLGVWKDGRAEPHHEESISAGVRVYAGEKSVFLEPGDYTYTIKYRTKNQLRYFKDFDEVYWNATGNFWDFPIERAKAAVRLPKGAQPVRYDAYTGLEGATQKNFNVQQFASGEIVFETTKALGRHEGLTVAVAFPKGFVKEPGPEEKRAQYLRANATAIAGLISLIVTAVYFLLVWNAVGRDPRKGTIIPLFAPPAGLSPALCQYIAKMGHVSWNKLFSATIVYMAVQGMLSIEKEEKKSFLSSSVYALHKKKGAGFDKALTAEHRIYEYLFAASSTGAIRMTQAFQAQIRAALNALQKEVKKKAGKVYFNRNGLYLVPGVIGTAVYFLCMMASAEGPKDDVVALVPIALVTVIFLSILTSALNSAKNIFQRAAYIIVLGALIMVGPLACVFLADDIVDPRAMLAFFGLVGLNALFSFLLMAPTVMGREIMNQVEGFKLYLRVAEKERFEALHPPEVTPEMFETYLPYAMALGVESEWAKKFEAAASAAAAAGAAYAYHNPHWYSGSDFSMNDITGFTSSFSSALSTSSDSASGGGGSSGGGGGGGGGGGW